MTTNSTSNKVTPRKRRVKKESQKQEKNVAKNIEGKTTIASGALYFQKADVRNDKYLVECKTTANDYYILTQAVWSKIQREATEDGLRTPIMQIDLKNGETRLVVMNYLDFIGYDFDKNRKFMGNRVPNLTGKMSYKICQDFMTLNLDEDTPTEDIIYPIHQFKLVDYNLHLVVLLFEDFLKFEEESATITE